ncbi:uncharacterized protein METZ01_LOCUS152420 [marine metagenome]|uniref:Uncharacterized protein n=1 Tax=marine metagenome TaxID=408172 RepID=A0A382ADG4_9ZZZZ
MDTAVIRLMARLNPGLPHWSSLFDTVTTGAPKETGAIVKPPFRKH